MSKEHICCIDCGVPLIFPESITTGLCISCREQPDQEPQNDYSDFTEPVRRHLIKQADQQPEDKQKCPECGRQTNFVPGKGWSCECGFVHEQPAPERVPVMTLDDIKVLEMVIRDVEKDAKEFDGKPFNGRTVAQYFGYHGAAIVAVTKILKKLIEQEER